MRMPVLKRRSVIKKLRQIFAERGFTMIEVLTVTFIVAILATMLVAGSTTVVRRKALEGKAILNLQRLATAEKRYFSEFGTFGYYSELVTQGYIPQGYSTRFFYNPLRWGESVLPFIDKYSLSFFIPSTPASVFFKIDAIPERSGLNLRTFNINLFLDGPAPDRIFQVPPVREGLSEFGEPVKEY